MFGAAFVELVNWIEEDCGLAAVDEVLTAAGVADRYFTAFEPYDLEDFRKLALCAAPFLGRSTDNILVGIGGRLLQRLVAADPGFLGRFDGPAEALRHVPALHRAWFVSMTPQETPPEIRVDPVEHGVCRLRYRSERPLSGFITGAVAELARLYDHHAHFAGALPAAQDAELDLLVRFAPHREAVA